MVVENLKSIYGYDEPAKNFSGTNFSMETYEILRISVILAVL